MRTIKEDSKNAASALLVSLVNGLARNEEAFREVAGSEFFKKTVDETASGYIISLTYVQALGKHDSELDARVMENIVKALRTKKTAKKVIEVNVNLLSRGL